MVTSAVNHQLRFDSAGKQHFFWKKKKKAKFWTVQKSFLENRYTENSVSCILENGEKKRKTKNKISYVILSIVEEQQKMWKWQKAWSRMTVKRESLQSLEKKKILWNKEIKFKKVGLNKFREMVWKCERKQVKL